MKTNFVSKTKLTFFAIGTVFIACLAVFFHQSLFQSKGPVRITVTTEPISVLPAHSHEVWQSPEEHGTWSVKEFEAEDDLWITSFSSAITGEPHDAVSQWPTPLHHVSIEVIGEADEACPGQDRVIFYGGTPLFSPGINFSQPYAIFVKKGSRMRLSAFWHNTAETMRDLTVSETLTAFTGKGLYAGQDGSQHAFVPITEYVTSVAGCKDRLVGHVSIPPRSKDFVLSTRDQPIIFPADGKIMAILGHYHPDANGKSYRALLNGKTIFETTADRSVKRNFRLVPDTPIEVSRGDTLVIEAAYDNPLDVKNFDAMADAILIFSKN